MEREEGVQKLTEIVGQDLRKLADKYGVTVFKDGNLHKGWAGHVLEKYLGLPISSSREPNSGSWELKSISLKYLQSGKLTAKEPMAIADIKSCHVEQFPFEESHLLTKFKRVVIAARIWESKEEKRSILHGVTTFDLNDPEIYNQVKRDYNLIRETIRTQGFSALTAKIGLYIQPKTKGTGHGSTSRAFYARVSFLKKFIIPLLSQEE